MSRGPDNPHAAEARERWGDTDEYRASTKRTKQYGDAEWKRIRAEIEAIEAGFAEAMAAGASPDSERATDLAEEARAHIDRWFYPCPPAMHVKLGEMYTADERFRAHYDDRAPGLAAYVAAAIEANAERATA